MAAEHTTSVTIQSLLDSGAIIGHKDGNYGSLYPRAEDFGSIGVPFLTAKSLSNGTIDIEGAPRLADDKASALRFGFLKPGDVLLSHNATIGRVAVVPEFNGRVLIGTSLTYFRVDPSKISPRYLAAYFSGRAFQDELAAVMSHSTRNQVPITAQRRLRVALPPLSVQRAIADVLGTLDEKIQLDRKLSSTLEAMARALFTSWFVDFDPVRTKAEGSDPGLPQQIIDLFPHAFEDSDLGEIPKGWRASKLGKEVATVLGGTPSRAEPSYWGGDIPWINSGKANEFRVVEPSEFITQAGLASSATKLLPARTTIIAITGATLGQISLAEIETCANQSIVGVLETATLPSEYIYFWIKEHVGDLLAWQTGGAQQHINKDNVNNLPVLCPSESVLSAYLEFARPAFDRIKACCKESLVLAAVRDALLPKLISGEVRAGASEWKGATP